MPELFDEYIANNNIVDALLVGRNMVNKDPGDMEKFRKYMELLTYLAENSPAIDDKKNFLNRAGVTLAFFEENAELEDNVISMTKSYHAKLNEISNKIFLEQKSVETEKLAEKEKKNTERLKTLTNKKTELDSVETQKQLDDILQKIADIEQENLTKNQKIYYGKLNKDYTNAISKKMAELERKEDISYNKKAVDAYDNAFRTFKSNEGKYKNHTALFELASTTLFAYDAKRLFNESLIYYNHVYSYIFSKLDDDGKLALTRYSIECERKRG